MTQQLFVVEFRLLSRCAWLRRVSICSGIPSALILPLLLAVIAPPAGKRAGLLAEQSRYICVTLTNSPFRSLFLRCDLMMTSLLR